MKKRYAFIVLILVMSLMMMSSCDLISKIVGGPDPQDPPTVDPTPEDPIPDDPTPDKPDPDDPPTHEHVFVEGKCECGEVDPDYEPPEEEPDVLEPVKIYLVGDSTVCAFDDKYYYPRYGYGTQLANYLAPEATVVNLALSGRSSKSFIEEPNYETLKSSIKAGDYLIVGFGHNDEKSDDTARFTDASKDHNDSSSFGYYLNEYYVKLALEVGATPILCTPIVRAATDDDYSESEGHVTANGDYAQAIRDLGAAVGVAVVDLTEITKAEYSSGGFDTIKNYHAVISGKYDTDGVTVVPNWVSIDKTHLNVYGAKFVAYNLALELSKLDGIGKYVADGIAAPKASDLVPLEGYKVPDYTAPDLEGYTPSDNFSTITDGWYGTAFGNTGGNPASSSNGYIASEVSEGVFHVGQHLDSGSNKGKFENASDGFAFIFRQVEADKNFVLTATGKVLYTGSTKQAGFGLMLRDDCLINQTATGTINSNYVTAGFLCDSSSMISNFYRENTTLYKNGGTASGIAPVDSTFTASIERVGQSVTVSVTYAGQTYTETFVDFDFMAVDNGYMYVGMFANRGTVIEFTDVHFEITGISQGA
jgi:lysophospholipase L1-like esterase